MLTPFCSAAVAPVTMAKRKAVIAFVGIILTTAIVGGAIFQYVV
ncbi:hypothetical protein BCU66_003205 [Vibrio sp. 10N.286.49.B1]|nr:MULTISPECIES: hypothetical protein [unclassified Vibrio]